jgi:hypothetical protein
MMSVKKSDDAIFDGRERICRTLRAPSSDHRTGCAHARADQTDAGDRRKDDGRQECGHERDYGHRSGSNSRR